MHTDISCKWRPKEKKPAAWEDMSLKTDPALFLPLIKLTSNSFQPEERRRKMALIHPEVAALQRSPSSAYLMLIVSLCGGGMKERVCFLKAAACHFPALLFVGVTQRSTPGLPSGSAGSSDVWYLFIMLNPAAGYCKQLKQTETRPKSDQIQNLCHLSSDQKAPDLKSSSSILFSRVLVQLLVFNIWQFWLCLWNENKRRKTCKFLKVSK